MVHEGLISNGSCLKSSITLDLMFHFYLNPNKPSGGFDFYNDSKYLDTENGDS